MNEKQNAMRTRPVMPLLLSMSMPVVLSMLIQSLYNIVDGLWVAKLGTSAISAVSLAFPLQNVVLAAGVGMGVGISSLMAIHLGAGDREQASRTASTGMMLVLIHCVLFVIGGLLITKPFLQLFTDDPETLKWACDYAYIVVCLSFAQLIQMGFEKIFQGAGKMMTTMFLMATGCIVNIVLDPILIFGLLGFPAMGVKGAAWATVIGQVFAMVLYLIVYAKKGIGVTIHPKYAKWDGKRIRSLYSVGVPSCLVLVMPSLLTGILNGILAKLGEIYVAVFGLYFKLQTFINLPSCGVIQGMRPIISYNYGAGEHQRVKKTVLCSLVIVALIAAFGTVIALGFPGPVLSLFNSDAELLEKGIPALQIIGTGFLISTVSVVACGVFEAMGKGHLSLVLSLLRQLAVLVPVAWVLSRFLGANGIWLAFPIAEAVTLIPSVLMLQHLFRTRLS